jgi:predicted nuclease of predicted toxin-antitoxin system
MKFLADMGISPQSAAFLRHLGHETVHLHEQGLDQLSDTAILCKARDEGRVLLTHDLDFGDLMAASGAELSSVVIFRLRDMRPERVNAYLGELVSRYQQALEEGVILSIKEGQIRSRSLPFEMLR